MLYMHVWIYKSLLQKSSEESRITRIRMRLERYVNEKYRFKSVDALQVWI